MDEYYDSRIDKLADYTVIKINDIAYEKISLHR